MTILNRSLLAQLALLVGSGFAVAILAGFANSLHPAFDTFAQFRLHFSVVGLILALLFVATRYFKAAIVLAMAGCLGMYGAMSGTLYSASPRPALAEKPVYTLLSFNLYWQNEDKETAIRSIEKLNPDLITFAEQSAEWRRLFAPLEQRWPYKFQCQNHPRGNATAVYSKWPLKEGTQYCGIYSSLAQISAVTPKGDTLVLGAVHMRWPWPASGPKQLQALRPHLDQLGDNALVAGDFNSVTWSNTTREFAKAGGLSLVSGIGPTWMADLPIIREWHWAGLPIDNVMAKGNVRILSAQALETMGSDHLPVLVRFQLQ